MWRLRCPKPVRGHYRVADNKIIEIATGEMMVGLFDIPETIPLVPDARAFLEPICAGMNFRAALASQEP